jgi:ABC-2 type transport system permease protein
VAIWREIYSRRKAFFVTTAIALVIVVGGLTIASAAAGSEGSNPSLAVGVVDADSAELKSAIERRLEPGTALEMELYHDEQHGENALRDETISALIVDDYHVTWGPAAPWWVVDTVSLAMRDANTARVSTELGLTPGEINRLQQPVIGHSLDYDASDEAEMVMAVITVIIMFVAILAYGQWIAYGVVEEKANRVAELILGAISPAQLLTAKMLALGGIGLAQLLIVGGTALVVSRQLTDIEVPEVAGSAWVWMILWFLVGYAFYASLYAASGSLAADSQEAGSMITPLNILPATGYMVGVIAFSSGAEKLLQVLSLIPLWTPMLMPGRMAQGTAAGWEIALAVALTIVTTLAVVILAGRVYLGGITQATRKVGWRQAFRGGRDLASES